MVLEAKSNLGINKYWSNIMKLGEKIVKVMTMLKHNQTTFAHDTGIERSMLNKMIHEHSKARPTVYIALEYITGIDREWFKTEDDREPVYVNSNTLAIPKDVNADLAQLCRSGTGDEIIKAMSKCMYYAVMHNIFPTYKGDIPAKVEGGFRRI